MTTEEYIRDPRFKVFGACLHEYGSDEPPRWYNGDDLHAALTQYDWTQTAILAHNAQFDVSILEWKYDCHPVFILDTLSMARALHGTEVGGSPKVLAEHYKLGVKGTEVVDALGLRREQFGAEQLAQYGEYCKNDVALTWKLYKAMGDFPEVELNLIDITLRMFTEPVLQLDRLELTAHLLRVQARKLEVLGKHDKAVLMSNPKFAEELLKLGVTPPMKVSPANGNQTYAFSKSDEEFTALLEHDDLKVQALVAARLGTKSTLEETRTERLIGTAERGPLPVPLRYYAAHTGRWGGDDKLNLQNLPRGSLLKKCIIAPLGYYVLDSDSSQIEARTLAWLAGQTDLVEAFDRGEDVYRIMAARIYTKAEADITKEERFVGKTTILGAGYGMGAARFQAQLKTFGVTIELDECKRIIDTYRKTYGSITKLWAEAGRAIDAIMEDKHTTLGVNGVLNVDGKKGILLPNGLRLKYPNLRKHQDDDGDTEIVYDTKKGKALIRTRIYGGKVIENVCQALARIIIGDQMLIVNKKYRVVMTVHDAIACVVPE
jgi:DNA polymerase